MKSVLRFCLIGVLSIVAGASTVRADTVIKPSISEERIVSTKEVVYSYKDKIPIIEDGEVISMLKVEQFQKLGIWDWYSSKAIAKSIKHSYTLNMQFKRVEGSPESFTVSCVPSFVNAKGKSVGEYCKVGWSGFPEVADFYSADHAKTIELGIQPTTKKESDVLLKLQFYGTDSKELNSVLISHSIFKSVVKGPSLVTGDSPVSVKSSNGGKLRISLSGVKKRMNKLGDGEAPFLDFKYKVKYLQAPTKRKEVAMFDQNNKNALQSKVVIGVQTDVSADVGYDSVPSALHVDAYGIGEYYVDDGKPSLRVGESTVYVSNRALDQGQSKAKYARFIFEFPEEVKADTPAELRKFNGRYRVVQVRLK